MRNCIAILLLTINICSLFGQNKDADKLKKYVSYTEEGYESGGWSMKYVLNEKGFVTVEENYLNKKLRSRFEYYYDEYNNQNKRVKTFDPDDGVVNDEFDYELVVDKKGRIIQKGSGNFKKIYSEFTDLGKPKLMVNKYSVGVDKHFYEYDSKGNVLKHTFNLSYIDPNDAINESTEVTQYRYDEFNNVIRLHRSNSLKWEYPIPVSGGPFQYEYEKFRYVYNRDGLWKKKFKTVEGKEYLIKKRKYTKR